MTIITSFLHFKIAYVWTCVIKGLSASNNKHLYL
jgi:hypothetical protein